MLVSPSQSLSCAAPQRRRAPRGPAYHPPQRPRSLPSITRRHCHKTPAAAAESLDGAPGPPSSNDSFAELQRKLEWQMGTFGGPDRVDAELQSRARQLATVVQFLQQQGVSNAAGVWLVLEHQHSALACDIPSNLGPKLQLFRRLVAAEPGWADALARALRSSRDGAALDLPLPAFEAALHFVAAQLQRVSRRRYQQLHQPFSLFSFVQLHPDLAGELLSRHPQQFTEHAAPWLQQHLGWDGAALADAALSSAYEEFCSSWDSQRAQDCLEWLLGLGLSGAEAGELLRADLRLLVGPERQLSAVQARVDDLAATLGVGARLASSLVLCQPWFTDAVAERTGQLLKVLQNTVGMSEEQVFLFALGGGLDEGSFTRTEAGIARATDRLKQLLIVCGCWPGVAALLQQHPDALAMPWRSLGSVLQDPAEQHAWQTVLSMQLAEAEQGALEA